MTLLDEDSRAVLGLLRRAAREPQQPLQYSAASHGRRAPLASDITNRPPKVAEPPSLPACLVRHLLGLLLCADCSPPSAVPSLLPARLHFGSEVI